MENIEPQNNKDVNPDPKPIEHDYDKHKGDPGPSKEAVFEKNDKGAGPTLKWIIPIILVILFILWFVYRK
jgi:hypothetical protein